MGRVHLVRAVCRVEGSLQGTPSVRAGGGGDRVRMQATMGGPADGACEDGISGGSLGSVRTRAVMEVACDASAGSVKPQPLVPMPTRDVEGELFAGHEAFEWMMATLSTIMTAEVRAGVQRCLHVLRTVAEL